MGSIILKVAAKKELIGFEGELLEYKAREKLVVKATELRPDFVAWLKTNESEEIVVVAEGQKYKMLDGLTSIEANLVEFASRDIA